MTPAFKPDRDRAPRHSVERFVGRDLHQRAFGLLTTMNPCGTVFAPCDAVETVTRDHPLLANSLICCSSCPGYRLFSTTLYSHAVPLV